MTIPGGTGRRYVTYSDNPPVLGTPASLIGSELPRARLRPFALPRCRRSRLMYAKDKSLLILYIRNIIPDNISIPLLGYRALSGWGEALFTQPHGSIILRRVA